MKVLVTGGRSYADANAVYSELDQLLGQAPQDCLTIIQGAASGADKLARDWCIARKVPFANYPADWTTYGRSAGPRRNQRMLDREQPDLVLAFPGGAGTEDMVARALRAGVPVNRYEPPRESRA
jgi:hypothetical protein